MQAWTARRLSLLGFVLAALLLTAVGWFSYRQMRTLADTTELVGHTLIVREQAEIVLSLLKDAETGQRGFVITGDPEYLDPYENARKLLPTYQTRLHELTRDNPAQQVALPRLDALIEARLQRLREGIRVRREDGFEAAASFITGDEGKRLMDAARDAAASVLDEERRLYELRVAQLAADSRTATVTNITGLVLAGALVLGATMLLSVAGRQREVERTARRVADAVAAASRESEHRLRVTLTSIGDGIIATDDKGRVTLINPVAQALTGWTEVSAQGRALEEVFEIVNETTRQPVENPVARVLREGAVVGMANHTVLIARDGREIAIDDSAAPITSVDGRALGVVMVFRDVTEQRELERQRAALLEREQAARREAELLSR